MTKFSPLGVYNLGFTEISEGWPFNTHVIQHTLVIDRLCVAAPVEEEEEEEEEE